MTKHTRVHTYSCVVCQKSFSESSSLSKHNKTAAHIKSMKLKNIKISLTQSSFVDCGEFIKEEDSKKEESVDDPLTIHQEIENSIICEDTKEAEEEESFDDPLTINQKIEDSNGCEDIKEEVNEGVENVEDQQHSSKD